MVRAGMQQTKNNQVDVVVIGAGAAGLFCAAKLGQSGLLVKVLDNGKKVGRKILMSGGGRCNFTNLYIEPSAYLSQNSHFCKSALARYTQWDFIELVRRYRIDYHEKTAGQLFCDGSAQQIVDMLLNECTLGKVDLCLRSNITQVEEHSNGFIIHYNDQQVSTRSLVVASGGLSMPGLGATPLGYKIAQQFGLVCIPTRAGLVPFTLDKNRLSVTAALSGISIPITATARCGQSFQDDLLFTHRGISGPAILQISNYWSLGEKVSINLCPHEDMLTFLHTEQRQHPRQSLKNCLAKKLPKRLTEALLALGLIEDVILHQLSSTQLETLSCLLKNWEITPHGTEGYRTAEVTLGGVATAELSSKTFEAKKVPHLYFIGEVVDVTGWLGGYNFQWAWSSAWACAQALQK